MFRDIVLAQDNEPRVPVAAFVDAKLAAGQLDGYQYADMPDDRETWRLVLRGLDEVADNRCGTASFAEAGIAEQLAIVGMFAEGELDGAVWSRLNCARAWAVYMRMALALSMFYSHPWAWNEIGFGGPAYPRGFMRLGGVTGPAAVREPFETRGATDEDPV